jgi:pimeloyl-ACP methyl ester carboxylesterase
MLDILRTFSHDSLGKKRAAGTFRGQASRETIHWSAQAVFGEVRTLMNMLENGVDLFTSANGLRLHYVKWASEGGIAGRPPVILLHSGLASGHCWDLVAPQLAEAGFDAFAPDLRGRGRSDQPATGYDLRTIAEDIFGFIQAVCPGRVAVVGHSYGAYVALALGAIYPNLLTKLVLVDGGIWSAEGETWEQFAQDMEATIWRYPSLSAYLDAQREGAELFWSSEVARALAATVQTELDGSVRECMTPAAWEQTLQSMWRYRPASLYPHITCPTLVIVTELPDSVPKEVRNQKLAMNERFLPEAMAGLRNCRIQVMEQTHHEVPFHKPVELANLITSFLRAI